MDELTRALAAIKESISGFDDITRAHSRRMMILSRGMAETIGLSESEGDVLELTCAIHDIGKRFIPAEILNKKGRLTKEEWAEIKTHPIRGWELLSQYAFLQDVADAILHHHERWDGSGYPYGRKKDAIPVIARIVSVIDAFDAMTYSRPYNLAMSAGDALCELDRHAGTQFDPEICSRFVCMYKERYF
ncbi:MAG: HD-GYP domain-containing protein [Clostridiaceae bacterium]|nr:HD-GYP domain-containing protein [Clostridiaceae bacterium]